MYIYHTFFIRHSCVVRTTRLHFTAYDQERGENITNEILLPYQYEKLFKESRLKEIFFSTFSVCLHYNSLAAHYFATFARDNIHATMMTI